MDRVRMTVAISTVMTSTVEWVLNIEFVSDGGSTSMSVQRVLLMIWMMMAEIRLLVRYTVHAMRMPMMMAPGICAG